jgi:hypothetical protein
MSARRKPLVLVAVALGVGACGALQGLDKPSEQRAARLPRWLTPTSAGLSGTF